jgi:putative endonuclease
MPEHIDLGKLGENLACDFLQQQNYAILFRNWRYSNAEIDIIASREKVLHFIEVKTRALKITVNLKIVLIAKKCRN